MAASEFVRTLQNLNRSCILHSLCSRDVRCFPGNAKEFEGRHRHKSSITMIRSHPLLSRSSSAQYCFGVRQQAHSRLVSSAITDRQRRRRRLSVTIRKQQCAAYTVEIEHAGGTTALDVEEGDTILETALEAGLELSHDCKMGVSCFHFLFCKICSLQWQWECEHKQINMQGMIWIRD